MSKLLRGKIRLDRKNSLPISLQLERRLAGFIQDGVMCPGDKLPHEVEWSRQLGVNRSTLRVALAGLAKRGMIVRRKKAGTFVAAPDAGCNNIGFFFFREATAFLSESLHHIQEFLDVRGYDLKVVAFSYDYYDKADLYAEMRRRDLRGAVLTEMPSPSCWRQLQKLEKQGFPYVRMGNKFFIGKLRAPLITGDSQRGFREALDFLRRKGHEKIGYISCAQQSPAHAIYARKMSRQPGYSPGWLLRIPLVHINEMLSQVDPEPLLRAYLRHHRAVTAVVTDSAWLAERFLKVAFDLGRPVPEKMSLISAEGRPIVDIKKFPAVTHMRVSRLCEAQFAVENLLMVVQNGLPPREQVFWIPPQLIECESVAPPPG